MDKMGSINENRCYIGEPEHKAKIEAIKQRCEKSGLIFSEASLLQDLHGFQVEFVRTGFYPNKHWLYFPDSLEAFHDIKFEPIAFLNNLEGIYDFESKTAEITLTGTSRLFLVPTFRLFANGQNEVIIEPPTSDWPTIRVGKASHQHKVLFHGKDSDSKTLSITNLKSFTSDAIENAIRSYAIPILLEIELKRGISLRLKRFVKKSMRTNRIENERKERLSSEALVLSFPSETYEYIPGILYLLAQGFRFIPSLRFLFAYQALEFFFIRVGREAAFKEIKSIIQDPSFDSTKEDQISRLLNAIQPQWLNPTKKEEEQLKSLMRKHISSSELKDFIDNDPELKDHLSRQNLATDVVVPKTCSGDQLVAECVKRLYSIRNAVVHSKEDDLGSRKIVFPETDEEMELDLDCDLLVFLTRKILTATAVPLQQF